MPVTSAGLLPYRVENGDVHVWLAHMGGPFWAKKDDASWTVIKGEYDESEDARAAAYREWTEETGSPVPGDVAPLGEFAQSTKKIVTVFVSRVDDAGSVVFVASNTVTLEWPPRSGRMQDFPEIDRAQWFTVDEARVKILRGQIQILDALLRSLDVGPSDGPAPSA